jgi:predicted acyl esterase
MQNEPTLVHVDLGSTAFVLGTGHKLRVIVSAAAGPNKAGSDPSLGGYSVNPQNGDEYIDPQHQEYARTGTIKVLVGHDRVTGNHDSALVVPVQTGQTPPHDHRPNTTPCPQ